LAIQSLAKINALVGSQYVTLSKHLSDVIRGHGGSKPINIIPVYGVDTKLFAPPKENKIEIKERLGLPTTGSIIFFSSRIAPEKDSQTLLTAFRALLTGGEDLWLLHRSGGYKAFLRAAEQFGVSHRVIATDAVHPHRQLPSDYQASDLCVQASREEGLGFSPIEALACGVPVVAAATGGLQATIIAGHTGWTYPVGDAKRLAEAMKAALSDPAESERRAAAGQKMVCSEFARDIVFERLERLLARGSNTAATGNFTAVS
jgi:glycosyltransferase involved in cell wall biosynthesis